MILYIGAGGRFGVAVQPIEELRIGGVYETGGTLTQERSVSTRLVDNNRELVDTTATSEGEITLPPRFMVGASYQTGRFLLSSDAVFQSWSKDNFPTARPSSRFAVGVDRLPSESMNATGFSAGHSGSAATTSRPITSWQTARGSIRWGLPSAHVTR